MIRSIRLLSVMFLSSLAIAACQTSGGSGGGSADQAILTGDEIRNTLIGNTISAYSYRSGNTFEVFYASDGKAYAQGTNFSDEGVWRIQKGNQMCFKWKEIRGGSEQCFRFKHAGKDIEALTLSGERNIRASIATKGKKTF